MRRGRRSITAAGRTAVLQASVLLALTAALIGAAELQEVLTPPEILTSSSSVSDAAVQPTGSAPGAAQQPYWAICAIAKDETENIREWVEHHMALGCEKFYVVDASASPTMGDAIADFTASGQVEYRFAPNVRELAAPAYGDHVQLYVYDQCLAAFGARHTWLAFIDLDEFIVLRDAATPSLDAFLQPFENYGGLALNWRMFGSSGHKTRPAGGTLDAYTRCLPRDAHHNHHVKTIVNTAAAFRVRTPHDFDYLPGKFAVNERMEAVEGPLTAGVAVDRIALHHYVLRSEDEFALRQQRGDVMGGLPKGRDFFDEVDAQATEDCSHLARAH